MNRCIWYNISRQNRMYLSRCIWKQGMICPFPLAHHVHINKELWLHMKNLTYQINFIKLNYNSCIWNCEINLHSRHTSILWVKCFPVDIQVILYIFVFPYCEWKMGVFHLLLKGLATLLTLLIWTLFLNKVLYEHLLNNVFRNEHLSNNVFWYENELGFPGMYRTLLTTLAHMLLNTLFHTLFTSFSIYQ